MGYNYRTTDPQDIDFITGSPTNLMQQAIGVADQQNDQQIQQADLLGNAVAKVSYLPADQDAVKAIQDKYNQQISDATTQILGDPANYQKHMPLIRSITRNLTSDLDDGELASYQNKANALAQWDKDNHQKVLGIDGKPGTVSPEAYQAARTHFLSDYNSRIKANGGSYNQTTKTSLPFNTEDLVATPDINKAIATATDNIKANSTDWAQDKATGQWIFTNKNKDESVEQARVAQIARDAVAGDPNITEYLKQGTRLGYVNGAYDTSGKFIEPYSTDAKGKIQWNPNSMLAAPIRSAVGRDAYNKVDKEQAMKDNPYGLKSFGSSLELGNEQKMAILNNQLSDASKDHADALKTAHDKDMAILHTALGNGVSLQSVMDKLAEGGSKTQLTASNDGVTTISPFAGEKKVTSDMINKAFIPDTQAQMADFLAKSKDPILTDNQRALFQQQYTEQKALYDQYNQWNGLAQTAAKNEVLKKYSPADLDMYYNYENPATNLKQNYQNSLNTMRSQLQSLTNPDYVNAVNRGAKGGVPASIPMYTDNAKAKELLSQIQGVSDHIDKYESIGNKLRSTADNWLQSNSKSTNFDLQGVGLSVANKQSIYDVLKSNPQVDIRNLNTDNSSGSEADKVKQIVQKVAQEDKPISDYLDLKTINSPAPGVGVTVTVRLKKPASGALTDFYTSIFGRNEEGQTVNNDIYNHDMIMTLPSSSLHDLGSNMKNSQSETEKQMGDLLTNKSKADFVAAANNRIMSKDADSYNQPISIIPHYDATSRQMLSLKVIPKMAPGSNSPQSYQVFVKDANGNQKLFTGTKDKYGNWSNPSGEWANTNAIADALYSEDKK